MRQILLVNNEPTPSERGAIVRAEELGLAAPLYNIDALSTHLSAFGTVTVRHYTQLEQDVPAPDGIVLSGCFTGWDRERLRETFAAELALVRETDVPLLGVCAGAQLIGLAFGAPLLYPGGEHEEFGFLPQTVVERHPLLDGLGGTFRCFEHHRGQLGCLPDGFRLLATRGNCPVQMFAHRTRPLFGTQFHPELQNGLHCDGQRILENFFQSYIPEERV